jgi:glycyl-tRNA synthetase beta chain
MVWNESQFVFPRPIRNIVALYNNNVVKFKIANVKSSRYSELNIDTKYKLKIASPEDYISHFRKHRIIIDHTKRYKVLKYLLKNLVSKIGGILINDTKLINELIYLVDYPFPILCSFNEKYLKLPHQIITTCIRKQKCFVISNKKNSLSNLFICVVNNNLHRNHNQDTIRSDYERVIDSLLCDAQSFYTSDIQDKVVIHSVKLKNITYHHKLGSIYDKLNRIQTIANFLNKEFFHTQLSSSLLTRAINLSKTDILSKIVFEYPELQGIIGSIYAYKLGENSDVANSIEQHYWPLANSDKLPISTIAIVIALSDRIDTLVTSFFVGLGASGSKDPYGLRRVCIGFLKIIKKYLLDSNLDYIIKKTFDLISSYINYNNKIAYNVAYEKIIEFFQHRLSTMLVKEGYNLKAINSVMNNSTKTIGEISVIYRKLQALIVFSKNIKHFEYTLLTFKRINNVLKQADKKNINIPEILNQSIFVDGIEQMLYKQIKSFTLNIKDYNNFFDYLIKLSLIINDFFKKIIIMDQDKARQANRLSLLKKAQYIFTTIIDLSFYL